ncbi:MAG: magnesium transporter, partial [Myxococcaceae bacterium]
FIPMVLVLSESLGVQTTAVSSHMLSEGRFRWNVLRQEVLATALAGLMAAVVVALLGSFYAWKTLFPVALFFAIGASTLIAASLGAVLPLMFRRFKVDPHLASAPLVLAASDNLTLLIYFSLVAWLLT